MPLPRFTSTATCPTRPGPRPASSPSSSERVHRGGADLSAPRRASWSTTTPSTSASAAFDAEPDRILGLLTRRDVDSASDRTAHDRLVPHDAARPTSRSRSGGVKQRTGPLQRRQRRRELDVVWDVVARDGDRLVRRSSASPIRSLASAEQRRRTLGLRITRTVARLHETADRPLSPRGAVATCHRRRAVAGGAAARQASGSSWRRTCSGQVNTKPAQPGNPLLADARSRWHVRPRPPKTTPSLSRWRSPAPINPDFGQVEADPAEVNLSAFETFFNERRPFFVEGSGAYEFECDDCSIFYSRRIRRPPRGAPDTRGGFVVLSGPVHHPRRGKLTGRLGGFSVGTLAAITQEEEARARLWRHARGESRWSRRRSIPCRACGASSPTSRRSA